MAPPPVEEDLLECEKGCGFEHVDEQVVEAHEKKCSYGEDLTPEMEKANTVLKAVMDHDQAFPFNEKVDWKKLKIKEYPKVCPRHHSNTAHLTPRAP
jgi:hypothetical protein